MQLGRSPRVFVREENHTRSGEVFIYLLEEPDRWRLDNGTVLEIQPLHLNRAYKYQGPYKRILLLSTFEVEL